MQGCPPRGADGPRQGAPRGADGPRLGEGTVRGSDDVAVPRTGDAGTAREARRAESPRRRTCEDVLDHVRPRSLLQRWNEGGARGPTPQESAQTNVVPPRFQRRPEYANGGATVARLRPPTRSPRSVRSRPSQSCRRQRSAFNRSRPGHAVDENATRRAPAAAAASQTAAVTAAVARSPGPHERPARDPTVAAPSRRGRVPEQSRRRRGDVRGEVPRGARPAPSRNSSTTNPVSSSASKASQDATACGHDRASGGGRDGATGGAAPTGRTYLRRKTTRVGAGVVILRRTTIKTDFICRRRDVDAGARTPRGRTPRRSCCRRGPSRRRRRRRRRARARRRPRRRLPRRPPRPRPATDQMNTPAPRAFAARIFRGDGVAAAPRLPRGYSVETGSRRVCRVDMPWRRGRGGAASATRIFRGDGVAAAPRLPRGYSVETGSRRRRVCHVDIPWRP